MPSGIYKHSVIDPKIRFWAKVKKTSTCWIWTSTLSRGGYGILCKRNGLTPYKAHRFSYELHKGKIPIGLHICHTCDNPPCVNPKHLFAGTKSDNMKDAYKKGRLKIPFNKKTEKSINSKGDTNA